MKKRKPWQKKQQAAAQSLPPHDPVFWAAQVELGISCDHSFGDDGSLMACEKCHMDRDVAHGIGKAHRRRVQHAKRMNELGLPVE